MNLKSLSKIVFALLSLQLCTACTWQTMEAGEYGVLFDELPRSIGGGVSDTIVGPGETQIVWVWQTLYRVDTTLQVLGWGTQGEQSGAYKTEYVETRAKDGNEVGLAISIRYHVDPNKVRRVIQKVGQDNDEIRGLVSAVARADIRTHMNILNTRDFFSQEKRASAVEQVKNAMNVRLEPEGIIIDSVIYKDHRFERSMGPGQEPDSSYQKQIDETQAKNQETEREEKRRAAIVQQKGKEKEMEQARFNRMIESAKGFRRQAQKRGDSYLAAKTNEAAQIKTAGFNEVEAMKKRIEALSGPGGKALLRLDIAKALAKSKPKFVLLNSSGNGVELNKVDTNELLKQAGFFSALNEGLKDSAQKPAVEADTSVD